MSEYSHEHFEATNYEEDGHYENAEGYDEGDYDQDGNLGDEYYEEGYQDYEEGYEEYTEGYEEYAEYEEGGEGAYDEAVQNEQADA